MKHLCSTIAMAVVLLVGNSASAQVAWQFADTSGNAQTNFTVPLGGTLQFRMYLLDSGTGAPTLNQQGGLQSFGIRLNSGTPANVTFNTSPTIAAPWTGNSTGSTASSVVMNGFNLSSGVFPDANGRILLGTFTANGLVTGSSTITALDPNPSASDNTSYFNPPFAGIDSLIAQRTATFTVSPVPEPSSLALIGLPALGLVVRRRYRRQTATV